MFAFSRVAHAAAAAGLAVAVLVGVSAPAHAQTGVPAPPPPPRPGKLIATLKIEKVGGGNCRTVVNGRAQMESQAAAQAQIDKGARAGFQLWGDDPRHDDFLVKRRDAQLIATKDGALFLTAFPTIPCSRLDEDDGLTDDNDEVYAHVYINMRNRPSSNTNVWHDLF